MAFAEGVRAQTEISANVGWLSEYFYRGIPQKTSSPSVGLDIASNGLYLGTWAADVGDGNEVDVYGGYGREVGRLSLGVGGTGYFYTGGFDNTYLEANLSAGLGPVSVAFAIGQYDSEPESSDYTFLSVTAEHLGAFATFGMFGSDFTGRYGEAGYGFSVADVDLTISWILSDGDLALLESGDSDSTLVLGVSKTLPIR
jgi:uncharacterized protein (TIGR02001 family)